MTKFIKKRLEKDSETKNESHSYLLPPLLKSISSLGISSEAKILDLGCGRGYITNEIAKVYPNILGIDPDEVSIGKALEAYPTISFKCTDGAELNEKEGKFDLIYAIEVIEHVYDPLRFIQVMKTHLQSDGYIIISTPYHSYFKNLILALTGKLDRHFMALTTGGHIKFWSRKTLSELLRCNDFQVITFVRCGRIALLAKSMIFVAKRTLP